MSFLQRLLFLIVIISMISSIRSFAIDIELTTESMFETAIAKIRKFQKELEEDENQLKIDRIKLEEDRQILKSIENIDILQLNIGGDILMTTRNTLTRIPKSSILYLLFNGRWEHKLQRDQNGNIFFDFNSILFRHLLDQLQIIEINNSIHLYPPIQLSFVEPFKKMLRKLGLIEFLSLENKNIITFNVGGQIITNQRTIFTSVSNSTFDTIILPSKIINFNNQSDIFLDYDPKVFQHLINQLRKESFKNISSFGLLTDKEKFSFETMLTDLNIFDTTSHVTTITVETIIRSSTSTTTTTTKRQDFSRISNNTKWKQNGLIIAGSNGRGNQLNELSWPRGIYVDDDNQCIYIADSDNHRIMKWKYDAKIGQVVAGGNESGNRIDQLDEPQDVIVDRKTDSLIICDSENRRIVRWPRRNGTTRQVIISNIDCFSLTMDNNGDLYVSDYKKHEVKRWKIGEKKGTIVAGSNGEGDQLSQLSHPTYLFVDEEHSVYVSDTSNHRVMKWMKDAKEGIIVAGGQGEGNSLTQLNLPYGVTVDHLDQVYVADCNNDRIMRWSKGSKEGRIIVDGKATVHQSNQLNDPADLSFDRQGNLYVIDLEGARVQKFEILLN